VRVFSVITTCWKPPSSVSTEIATLASPVPFRSSTRMVVGNSPRCVYSICECTRERFTLAAVALAVAVDLEGVLAASH
jgi:hypothetical protein